MSLPRPKFRRPEGLRTPEQVAALVGAPVSSVRRLIAGPLDAYAFGRRLKISAVQFAAYFGASPAEVAG